MNVARPLQKRIAHLALKPKGPETRQVLVPRHERHRGGDRLRMDESRCKIPYRAKIVSIAFFRSVLYGCQNILLRKGRRIVPTDRYGHALTFDFGIVSRGEDHAEIRSARRESIGEIGAEELGKSLEYGVHVTKVRGGDFDGIEDIGGELIGDAGIAKDESLSVEAGQRFDDLGCVVGTDVVDDFFFGGELERFDGWLGEHG
mmetsp:Transcript_26837/g.53772  ORF Transcript_26837/g.53772 Transcript_26837/m.53772 type:complete len:202 (+) Transcript_26837:168-773(+)